MDDPIQLMDVVPYSFGDLLFLEDGTVWFSYTNNDYTRKKYVLVGRVYKKYETPPWHGITCDTYSEFLNYCADIDDANSECFVNKKIWIR